MLLLVSRLISQLLLQATTIFESDNPIQSRVTESEKFKHGLQKGKSVEAHPSIRCTNNCLNNEIGKMVELGEGNQCTYSKAKCYYSMYLFKSSRTGSTS